MWKPKTLKSWLPEIEKYSWAEKMPQKIDDLP
jgi:hypothetical protein